MVTKVTLLNRLKMALSSTAGEADEIQSALNEWRVKALSVLLIVIAVAALPSYSVSIVGAIQRHQLTFPVLIYPIAYVTFVILALSSRLSFRARATIFFLLAYTNAVASSARLGLAGSGRLYLLTLPVMATLLIGARTGFITAALSIAIYAVFALLTHFGVLANWLTEPTNPLNFSFWIDAGLAFSVFLAIYSVAFLTIGWLSRPEASAWIRIRSASVMPASRVGASWVAVRALEDIRPYQDRNLDFWKVHIDRGSLLSDYFGTRMPETVFAHSSPVYVIRDGMPIRSWDDARYYVRYLDNAIDWLRTGAKFAKPGDRTASIEAFERARAIYMKRSEEAGNRT